MQMDLRYPIGLLFTLYGLMLAGVGIVANPDSLKKSLGVNVNLWWGLVLLVFGVIMLVLAWRGRVASRSSGTPAASNPGAKPNVRPR